MKIVFVNVPNLHELIGNDPVIIKEQQGVYPPLGILYMAQYLLNTGRYDVHVIDAQCEKLSHAQIGERVKQLAPDVVGITAMTFTLVDVKMVIQEIRKRCNPYIVVGGPHTAIYPNETFNPKGLGADFVVVGEGEITMDELCQDIASGKVSRTDGIARRTYRQKNFIQDLDELPFAARELTQIDKYYSVLSEETPSSTAFTSRGCPFSCSFCLSRLTKILMSDFTWKLIPDIKVGDEVVGVLKNGVGEQTRYVKTKVTHVFKPRLSKTFEIKTEYGSIEATSEHQWLTTRGRWRETNKLSRNWSSGMRFLAYPQDNHDETIDYKQGYICGALKGDGCFKRYQPKGSRTWVRHLCQLVGDHEMMETVLHYSNSMELNLYKAKFNGGMYKNITWQVRSGRIDTFNTIESWYLNISPEYERGFLSGFFDADGSWTSAPRFHGQDKELLDYVRGILTKNGYESIISIKGDNKNWFVTLHGGLIKWIEFFGWCQPKVKRKWIYWNKEPRVHRRAMVLDIKPSTEQLVYNFETENHTYIANGFVSHNCDRPALGKGFRPQSPKRVVDEMEHCEKLGIKDMFFYDDTFSVSMKRVVDICSEYNRRGLTMKWDIRTRVNVVNEELLKAMYGANCTRIHFGVETAVPRVVKELQKGITADQVEKAFDMCHRIGIKTLAYLMMGNPTETIEDVKATLAMARRIKPDYMQMTILSPFPATTIYMRALKEGVVTGDPWRDYAERIHDDFRPPLWDAIYSRKELESHLRWFYRSFYLQPSFVMDRVREVKNFGQFKRYASAGISLLKMTLIPESKAKDYWRTRKAIDSTYENKQETAVQIA